MHEVHLMKQVVKTVGESLGEATGSTPAIVRLRVSALSHLADHDPSSLQSVFELASLGTKVEGAKLEIISVPVQVRCRSCGLLSNIDKLVVACETCGATDLDLDEVPEVVVQEVVVTE